MQTLLTSTLVTDPAPGSRRGALQQLRGRLQLVQPPAARPVFLRRLDWIRDHHPPAALYMLGYVFADKMGQRLSESNVPSGYLDDPAAGQILDWSVRALSDHGLPAEIDLIPQGVLHLYMDDQFIQEQIEIDGYDPIEGERATWDVVLEDERRSYMNDHELDYEYSEEEARDHGFGAWLEFDDDGPKVIGIDTVGDIRIASRYIPITHRSRSNDVTKIESFDGDLTPGDIEILSTGPSLYTVMNGSDDVGHLTKKMYDAWTYWNNHSGLNGVIRDLVYWRREHPNVPIGELGFMDLFHRMIEDGRALNVQLLTERYQPIDQGRVREEERAVVEFEDGARIVEILGGYALKNEGLEMTHCIGTRFYGHPQALAEGRVRVFSYRLPDGTPRVTWEVGKQTAITKDLQGPHNGPIHDDDARVRMAWFIDRFRDSMGAGFRGANGASLDRHADHKVLTHGPTNREIVLSHGPTDNKSMSFEEVDRFDDMEDEIKRVSPEFASSGEE